VRNSELLRQYSLVDPRVKSLMVTVKRWTKQHKIGSTQDNCLSSYAWMNLVIFYLQSLGLVPNLQCPALTKTLGIAPDPDNNYWHSVNNLNTFFLKWDEVSGVWSPPQHLQHLSVTALLYGFFHFYAKQFPMSMFCVSIRVGGGTPVAIPKTAFRKASLFWCIEDPFETVDSHCPHDLGVPANNEFGARKIVECMEAAEVYLRRMLLEILSDKEKIAMVTSFWPLPVASKETKTKTTSKPNGANDDASKTTGSGKRNQSKAKKSVPNSSSVKLDGKSMSVSLGASSTQPVASNEANAKTKVKPNAANGISTETTASSFQKSNKSKPTKSVPNASKARPGKQHAPVGPGVGGIQPVASNETNAKATFRPKAPNANNASKKTSPSIRKSKPKPKKSAPKTGSTKSDEQSASTAPGDNISEVASSS
jgi:DNA polymerase sigma